MARGDNGPFLAQKGTFFDTAGMLVCLMSFAGRTLTLALPLLALFACAVGQDIPEDSAALEQKVDAGAPTGSIRVDASTPKVTETPDAAAAKPDASTADDAAAAADTAPPPPPPGPAVCDDTNPKYGLLLIALALSGTTPPPCSLGCNSGECCYQNQYCMP